MNFFAARKENLPSVKSAGDVIFLHLAEVASKFNKAYLVDIVYNVL